jgi:DNA primase
LFDAPTRQNDAQRVRDASDIVRIVGEHIALKPKGREYVGLCPFHDDHKPSMSVVPQKQIFHCFSCDTGGDVFTFVQKYHRMTFPEALEYLAQRAGVDLAPRRADSAEHGVPDRAATGPEGFIGPPGSG